MVLGWAVAASLPLRTATAAVENGPPANSLDVTSPLEHQVFQRNGGKAVIPIKVSGGDLTSAYLLDADGNKVAGARFDEATKDKIAGVPTGGPYTLALTGHLNAPKNGTDVATKQIEPLFVGELWGLATKSATIGGESTVDSASLSQVRVRNGGKWDVAKPGFVGAGVGLPFTAELAKTLKAPIGLVLNAVDSDGVPVKGVIASDDGPPTNSTTDAAAIGGLAKTLRQGLVVPLARVNSRVFIVLVQSSRDLAATADDRAWGYRREIQRQAIRSLANASLISSIDLEAEMIGGAFKIGADGLKRLGRRAALVAEREVYGLAAGASAPDFDRVVAFNDTTLQVKLQGLNAAPPKEAKPDVAKSDAGASTAASATTTGQTANATAAIVQIIVPASGAKADKEEKAKTQSASTSASDLLELGNRVHGFSIRDAKGKDLDLIVEATIISPNDTIELTLKKTLPTNSWLWYGFGSNPICNLTDGLDMAVPAFGPIEIPK